MTNTSRIWIFFACITFGITGLLVLLRMDGLSDEVVFATAMVALCPHVLLFRSAWEKPEGTKIQRYFYRWAAACVVGLTLAHFIADRAN